MRDADLPSIKTVPTGSRVASAQALESLGDKAMSTQQQQVFDLVLSCKRRGIHDMTYGEIEQAFLDIQGKRMRASSITGRLNSLIAAGRLVRLDIRVCSVTNGRAGPVHVPDEQGS